MLHLNFSYPFPLDNYSILFYLHKFLFLLPLFINALFSEKILLFSPISWAKGYFNLHLVFHLSFGVTLPSLSFFFFKFFFFLFSAPIQSKGETFYSWSPQNQVVGSESWSPSLSHLMSKNTTKARKGRKMQSLILDLLPALEEVGKDNSVLFCCGELWFLLWWFVTTVWQSWTTQTNPALHFSHTLRRVRLFVVDMENLEDFRH